MKLLRILIIIALSLSVGEAARGDGLMSLNNPPVSPLNKGGIKRGVDYVKGEVIVKYKKGVSEQRINEIHGKINAIKKKDIPNLSIQSVKIPDHMSVEEAIAQYKNDPNIEYAEPNYILRAFLTPNDTSYNQLWGLNNTGQTVNGTTGTNDADIDAPEAWDLSTGSSSVVVAVIDTGVAYDHPDLSANIWSNTDENCTTPIGDNDGNGYANDCRGWDFLDNDNDPMDYNGHGTHVAGTIGAVGNNSSGVVGVNWTVKIMPLRFLDAAGSGSTSDAVSAINYAANNGANIINASWGGGPYSQALYDAINNARSNNVLFVAAAGNSANNNDTTPSYPASYNLDNIISVAATTQTDGLASFSNYGAASVDVGAPGYNIYSTIPARTTIWPDNFDDGNISDWTTGGTNNTWNVTTELRRSLPYSLTDSPGANYLANTDSWARSPAINLTGNRGCKLTYYLELNSESGYDGIFIEASSDGANFTTLSGYSGSTGGAFYEFEEDLTNYDGLAAVYIRFRFVSDNIINYNGAHIDDVSVNCYSPTYSGTEYSFLAGTSMASPHVAGLAGLIKAYRPAYTYSQIKETILSTVDPKTSLSGKVLTGGRINAFSALSSDIALLLPVPPSNLTASAAIANQINLSWTDNSVIETEFRIERSTNSNTGYAEIAVVGPNVTTYSNTSGLTVNTTYYYRVRAYNTNGFSAYSNVASATVTPVSAPSNLSATAVSTTQINLSWTDNSTNETGFRIERKTGINGTYAFVTNVAANATTYSNTGLSSSTTYYYRVRAYNASVNSIYSNEANATTQTPAPPPPPDSGGDGGGGGGCGFVDNNKNSKPPIAGMMILLLPLAWLLIRKLALKRA